MSKLPVIAELRTQRLSVNQLLLTAQVAGEYLRSNHASQTGTLGIRWPRNFITFCLDEHRFGTPEIVSLARALTDTGPASNMEPLGEWFLKHHRHGNWPLRDLTLLAAGLVCDTRTERSHDVGNVLKEFLVEVARSVLARKKELGMVEDKDLARLFNCLSKYPRNGRHFPVIKSVFDCSLKRVVALCMKGDMSPMSLSLIVNGMGKVMIPVTTVEVRRSMKTIQDEMVKALDRGRQGWDDSMEPQCVPNLLNGFCKLGCLNRQFLAKVDPCILPVLKDSRHLAVLLHAFVKAGGRQIVNEQWKMYLFECAGNIGQWVSAQAAACSVGHAASLGLATDQLVQSCDSWIDKFTLRECLLVVEHLPEKMLQDILRRARIVSGTLEEVSDLLWALAQRNIRCDGMDTLIRNSMINAGNQKLHQFGRLAKLAGAAGVLQSEQTDEIIAVCERVVDELGPAAFGIDGLEHVLFALALSHRQDVAFASRLLNHIGENDRRKERVSEELWIVLMSVDLDTSTLSNDTILSIVSIGKIYACVEWGGSDGSVLNLCAPSATERIFRCFAEETSGLN
ncbi:hypothetical protein FOL47_000679 [Perkinsus chesapeaki]|uniref:Uncharacterized protein n=1 Tax=Perkinsus chesapeaki TaxID=330153 RepID=A0A7J6KUS2_PERCH|nr:hypothetical protein FOL47_000679 [Perkinsus chesapeaki]